MTYLLIIMLIVMFVVAQFLNCTIIINPIKGIMLGALYNDDVFENETEHTVQILIFMVSFSFVWVTLNK